MSLKKLEHKWKKLTIKYINDINKKFNTILKLHSALVC